jgi:predicted CoA-binding protein
MLRSTAIHEPSPDAAMVANPSDERIRELLERSRTIAVVGLSPRPARPSHQVARYLIAAGYRVVPVNPGHAEILGLPCYPDLKAVPESIDIVDCFRRSDQVSAIAEDAVAVGAKVLWLQLGVVNGVAAEFAAQAGLAVVMDRCIKIDHALLGIRFPRTAVEPAERSPP